MGRQYFYVDYKHFCDVVKWRVAEMHRVIDTGLRNVSPVQACYIIYTLTELAPTLPSNSTTKGIYVRCAVGHTPP